MKFPKAVMLGGFVLGATQLSGESGGFHELLAAEHASQQAQHRVRFMGFQALPDGASRLFVHLTSEPALTRTDGKRHVTFTLSETSGGVRNNLNPLNFQHFEVPLLRAQLVEVGSDLELRLKLRADVAIRHHFERLENGGHTLHIDFAPRTR